MVGATGSLFLGVLVRDGHGRLSSGTALGGRLSTLSRGRVGRLRHRGRFLAALTASREGTAHDSSAWGAGLAGIFRHSGRDLGFSAIGTVTAVGGHGGGIRCGGRSRGIAIGSGSRCVYRFDGLGRFVGGLRIGDRRCALKLR